ncbi:MAG: hypothetical protein FWF31_04190 [Desulfobulbus sp.]|nr:hypothetical protein [Desulfobulbus sp.]
MELHLKWLDSYERQEGENAPVGLFLCAAGSREQVELLEMRKDGIMVAEYWTELPPKKGTGAKNPRPFTGRARTSGATTAPSAPLTAFSALIWRDSILSRPPAHGRYIFPASKICAQNRPGKFFPIQCFLGFQWASKKYPLQ